MPQKIVEQIVEEIERLKKEVEELKGKRVHQSDIPRETIKQGHIEGRIIFTGLAANRPDGSTEVKCFFATDTFVLSIWTGSAWKTTTLS